MASNMSEEELYRLARKRVEEKKGFYVHFAVYLAVNALLIMIWWFTGEPGGRFPWFIFPLGGWGIGVLFHFLVDLTVYQACCPSQKSNRCSRSFPRLRSTHSFATSRCTP